MFLFVHNIADGDILSHFKLPQSLYRNRTDRRKLLSVVSNCQSLTSSGLVWSLVRREERREHIICVEVKVLILTRFRTLSILYNMQPFYLVLPSYTRTDQLSSIIRVNTKYLYWRSEWSTLISRDSMQDTVS